MGMLFMVVVVAPVERYGANSKASLWLVKLVFTAPNPHVYRHHQRSVLVAFVQGSVLIQRVYDICYVLPVWVLEWHWRSQDF